MTKRSKGIILTGIFTCTSMYLLFDYINSITFTLNDNRLNVQILVQLIRKLKMQLPLLFLGGVIYALILVFIDKRYSSDKHKDMQ